MVHPEELAALDLLVWLRTGMEAGRRLHCNQSTISRRVEVCKHCFGIELHRVAGEWCVSGNTILLEMERTIHQIRRFQRREQLRLEVSPWLGNLLGRPAPKGWLTGMFDHLGVERPLRLLRDRVIDAWFCDSAQEVETAAEEEWTIIDFGSLPLVLMADRSHPLVGETGLEPCDLHRFPILALPAGLYPFSESILRSQGLGGGIMPADRYSQEGWEGRTRDQVTLCYGNGFSQALSTGPVPLDWNPGCPCRVALVAHGDLNGHGLLLQLAEELRQRLALLTQDHPVLQRALMA